MKRRRVKLGLYSLRIAQITPFCENVSESIAASGNFATPNPPLTEVDTAIANFDKAYKAALDGGKALKATQKNALIILFNVMRQLRDYVNQEADGDEEILNTSGFPLAELPEPVGPLSKPTNVRNKTLEQPGEVEVACDKVDGATAYQVRHQPDTGAGIVDTAWVQEDPTSSSRQTVSGLASAKYHWLQMRAIGSNKPSAWSNVTKALAG